MSDITGEGVVIADAEVVPALPPGPSDPRFLLAFPEFNDASKYPYLQRKMWFDIALANIDGQRWGDYYEAGVYLFTAHHLAIFANQKGKPGMPGRIPFPVGSKSVGSVSVSVDTSILQGQGFWGLTTYGLNYNRIAQIVGMGGIQIGYGPLPPTPTGPGYHGPDMGYPWFI